MLWNSASRSTTRRTELTFVKQFCYLRDVNVWFTFDYELFFGNPTGSVEKCMIEPTNRLMELSKKFDAPFTYFVDAGFLFKLHDLSSYHHELADQHALIADQLIRLIENGNDIQLHIHPHWELSTYDNGSWNIPQDKGYRLDEFSQVEAHQIFTKYKSHLDQVINRKTIAYRAGGWCVQPFLHIQDAFLKNNIHFDSSVVPGMVFNAGVYQIDFSKAPMDLDAWCFDLDPTQVNRNGRFVEIPISSHEYNPIFYWELYVRGRLNRRKHTFVGDGNFIPQPGRKLKTLTQSQWNHVSCDGFYAKKLKPITQNFIDRKRQHLVIIGHPKSMTAYSFDKIERYLNKVQKKVSFLTFTKYHDQTR